MKARTGRLTVLALAALAAAAVMPGAHAARSVTVDVPGNSNLWLAGGNPAPGDGPGVPPPVVRVPDGAISFKVTSATGLVNCCGGQPDTPPDGGASPTSITPTTGSIGPYEGPTSVPLIGVFLSGDAAGDAPADLDEDDDGAFRSLSPELKQPFFIGDGETSTGVTQTFRVPDGARRLYLGIPDAFGFNGPPQGYGDNSGSFTAAVRFDTGSPDSIASLPAPKLGKVANAGPVKGEVLIGIPDRGERADAAQKGITFVPLEEPRQIPIGSFLDTRDGTVALATARDSAGTRQSGRFAAGLFQVLQSRKQSAKGLTELRLKGSSARFRSCDSGGASASALSRRTIRRLRARARGRYRTRGRHSAATVRGTVWTTADRCDGTLTTVKRGAVAVRDFRLKKTITVKAGKSYLARAAG